MMNRIKLIAPSILSADFGRLACEIESVEAAGADWIHVDVMDGHFVPNITIGPPVIRSLRKATSLPFDVHLMIEHPERYIEDFAAAGSDWITVHVETAGHLHRTVSLIKGLGKKAGVSLNPSTSLHQVEEILQEIDLLLIMTVNPGFGGQKFIGSMMAKIERARRMADALPAPPLIEVDGGITPENIEAISTAGVDVFVAGSSVFTGGNYGKNILEMKRRAEKASPGRLRAKEA